MKYQKFHAVLFVEKIHFRLIRCSQMKKMEEIVKTTKKIRRQMRHQLQEVK